MQNWDEILYPPFRSTIRGEYYGIVTQDFIDEECYNLALRAISAFKFPKISTEYETFWAIRLESGALQEVTSDTENAIPHGRFISELTYAEIEVILAWMKVYWAEALISNADNFDEMYTDNNIKTYSRANAVDKNLKLLGEYRTYAKDLENRYSRINSEHKSSLGDINSDDD